MQNASCTTDRWPSWNPDDRVAAGGESKSVAAFNEPMVTVPAASDHYFDLNIDNVSDVRYCEYVFCASGRPKVRHALIYGTCPDGVDHNTCYN